MTLLEKDIEKYINIYLSKISTDNEFAHWERYSSYDYCYNYFQSFYKNGIIKEIANDKNIEQSVLQLGFYLASWGMYRGSTALLRHSSHCLIPIVRFISESEPIYWDLDINNYETNFNTLTNLYTNLGNVIKFPIIKSGKQIPQQATPVLITKIMLGVWGCSPAMDDFFMTGIGKSQFGNDNFMMSLKKVLIVWQMISEFYKQHHMLIDSYCIKTLSFTPNVQSSNTYTKAKIIDMIFFTKGMLKKQLN